VNDEDVKANYSDGLLKIKLTKNAGEAEEASKGD